MKKSDKKLDNQIRNTLTDICDEAIEKYSGFQWLTHSANYAAFPKSLKVICVFDTNAHLKLFMQSQQRELNNLIKKSLTDIGAPIQDIGRQIKYDTEENCNRDNAGDWGERLAPTS